MGDTRDLPDKVSSETPIAVVPGLGPTLVPESLVPDAVEGYLPHAGVEMDNVYKSEGPNLVRTAGDQAGVRSEWDAASIDSAITWLEEHGNYLYRLSFYMEDINDVMGGTTGKSPVGGFKWATDLAARHSRLYGATKASVEQLSKNLLAAAEGLRTVKDNYEKAEERNAMSAADMQKAFVAGNGPAA